MVAGPLPGWVWGRPHGLVSRGGSVPWASTACERTAGISAPAGASQPQGRLPGGGGLWGVTGFTGLPGAVLAGGGEGSPRGLRSSWGVEQAPCPAFQAVAGSSVSCLGSFPETKQE